MGIGDFFSSVGKFALGGPVLAINAGGAAAAKSAAGPGGLTGLVEKMNQNAPASFQSLPGDPNSSKLRGMMDDYKFTPVDAATINPDSSSYTAKDYSKASLPQYDAIRSRLDKQYNQQQQTAQDAIDRQFAAAGGGPGNGAQVKQTENLAAQTAKQKGADLEGVTAQEEQTRQQLQQVEDQKAFQSSEAGKQRAAAAEQFNAGSKNQTSQFNAQGVLSAKQFAFDANSKIAALDNAAKSSEAEFQNNAFNREMALYQQQHSGGLFGGGGTLGLGI